MSIRHTKYRKPPVFEGELFVEKEPPDGYVGKHAFWNDHDRIGQNGILWIGCRMCREQLGMSEPPTRMPRREQPYHYPSL